MKNALIAVTRNGALIAERIKTGLSGCDGSVFVLSRYAGEGCVPFDSLRGLTAEIFASYDALVFICACGIAVRMVAPHLVSKQTDPAVIAIDEQGQFAVSLLAGHLGGANALTKKIAALIGAVPVITTATDAGGLFSPDLFAQANDLHICEPDAAKAVAAAVVDGRKFGLRCDYPYVGLPPSCDPEGACETGIVISRDTSLHPFPTTLHLLPRNIVIGAGCKKNTPPAMFAAFVAEQLREHGLPLCRVAALHTVDLKKDEPAMREFCAKNGIPLCSFPAARLMSVPGDFTPSEFVRKTVGADNVCERSAALGGRVIVRKQRGNGVTFAAAEREILIDFGSEDA